MWAPLNQHRQPLHFPTLPQWALPRSIAAAGNNNSGTGPRTAAVQRGPIDQKTTAKIEGFRRILGQPIYGEILWRIAQARRANAIPNAQLQSDISGAMERAARGIRNWDQLKQTLQSCRKDCRVPLARSREQVRAAMREALHEQPPPSLSEIARRLDYKGVEGFRDVDKTLSKQLAANYRKSGRTHWWRKPGAARICEPAEIQAVLEQLLAEKHPRSLYELAVSLGYVNEGYIQLKFPQLCSAIRQKIRTNNEERITAMKRALESALNDEPPASLEELRRQLGYSCSTVLKKYFPGLCDEVSTRRRLHRRQKILELTKALESALSDVPAPSLVSLCKTLNTPEHTLEKMCPRECASIRARYRHARVNNSVRRKEQLQQDVRKILRKLHGEGKYPTIKQVGDLLGSRNNWFEVSAVVATIRTELCHSLTTGSSLLSISPATARLLLKRNVARTTRLKHIVCIHLEHQTPRVLAALFKPESQRSANATFRPSGKSPTRNQ